MRLSCDTVYEDIENTTKHGLHRGAVSKKRCWTKSNFVQVRRVETVLSATG